MPVYRDMEDEEMDALCDIEHHQMKMAKFIDHHDKRFIFFAQYPAMKKFCRRISAGIIATAIKKSFLYYKVMRSYYAPFTGIGYYIAMNDIEMMFS